MIVPNAGMAANQTATFGIGSYQMPFNGRLVADMKCRCTWTAAQTWFRAWLNPSSPAPGGSSQHCRWAGFPGGWGYGAEIPVKAVWDNLAAGTTVNLVGAVYAGTLGGLTMVAFGGFVRASPT